jgi:hypothetical protein
VLAELSGLLLALLLQVTQQALWPQQGLNLVKSEVDFAAQQLALSPC